MQVRILDACSLIRWGDSVVITVAGIVWVIIVACHRNNFKYGLKVYFGTFNYVNDVVFHVIIQFAKVAVISSNPNGGIAAAIQISSEVVIFRFLWDCHCIIQFIMIARETWCLHYGTREN